MKFNTGYQQVQKWEFKIKKTLCVSGDINILR